MALPLASPNSEPPSTVMIATVTHGALSVDRKVAISAMSVLLA
jgi:hypothetical protein